MKWYNYKDLWINLENVESIEFYNIQYGDNSIGIRIYIRFSENEKELKFDTFEERDAEFEKIKDLMGIKDYTSRCC